MSQILRATSPVSLPFSPPPPAAPSCRPTAALYGPCNLFVHQNLLMTGWILSLWYLWYTMA